MNAIKLVISDVDGTLVNKAKQLTPGVIDAVKRLEDAGVPFTLISARPPSGLIKLAEALELDRPLAAFNGGTLFRRDGTVTERHKVDPEVVRGFFELVEGEAVDTWVFASGRWHTSGLEGVHVEHERVASAQEPILTEDFSPLYDDVDKLTFVTDDPVLMARLTQAGQERFGDRATVGNSQTYYLDVTDTIANKGNGVETLAHALGIDLADTAVIGDMPNDLPMLRRAGTPIAMGQAPDEVKAAARFVTTSNEEDGVAAAIDRYVLARAAA
jgi:Cof subfamily protein (haloacid dehalogenase superfamily)